MDVLFILYEIILYCVMLLATDEKQLTRFKRPSMVLTNKTVVVTGANGALGKVVAQKALDCGATVVMFDIAFSEESLPNGERAIAKTVDLLDVDSIQEQLADLPRVDVVLNLAGGFTMGPTVYEVEDKDWNFLFDINVNTMRNMIRVAVPKMLAQGGGAIVNVGALAALEGVEAMGAYCASKSVVMRLTESLSAELKQQGINVNAVLPSIIDTPANRAAMPDADPSLWVDPQDLAEVICFLASDSAKAIHGALLPVAGLS